MKERGNKPASVCSGYLGERFNDQHDLAKMLNDIDHPDLPKLEYLAFSAGIEDTDLESITIDLQRYLEVIKPFRQFLSDDRVVEKAESLLAVFLGRQVADQLSDIVEKLNDNAGRTSDKVSRSELELPLPDSGSADSLSATS